MGQVRSKVRPLNFRIADFQILRNTVGLPGRLPSETREKNTAAQELAQEHKTGQGRQEMKFG